MPLFGPLPALLREALERVYDEHPEPERPPVISDLVAAAEAVLAAKGYSAETNSDIRAALEVRLGILTHGLLRPIFQCRRSFPAIEHLVQAFSVHELDRLPRETACLYTLILLTWVRQYFKSLEPAHGLRLVIVIEEAHNIVGRSTQAVASEEGPDPRTFAADLVCRLLAELRALGVGVVIVDQLPSEVAPQVVKNTASKLAFRQVATDDRAELGGAMLFGKTEMEECARLRPGEAFFSTEGYYGPRRVQTTNLHVDLDLTPLREEELSACLRQEAWFREAAELRCATELAQLKEWMDAHEGRRAQILVQAARLRAQHKALLGSASSSARRARLQSQARRLKTTLLKLQCSFERGPYRALLPSEGLVGEVCPALAKLRTALVQRYTRVMEADQRCCGVLTRMICDPVMPLPSGEPHA